MASTGQTQPDEESSTELGGDVPFYTIGQVATLLHVPAAQLRRLDDLEFVQPDRSDGNQRRYTQNEIDQLREVVILTQEGVTLPGVRRVLELRRRVDDLERQLADSKHDRD